MPIYKPHLDNRSQSYGLHGDRGHNTLNMDQINQIVTITIKSDPKCKNKIKTLF